MIWWQGITGGSGGGSNAGIIAAIAGAIAALFGFGKDSTGAVVAALKSLASWTSNAVRSIRDVLSAVTGRGIWETIKRIGRALDAARKRLAGWIAPLMEWLKKVRDWLDWIYHRVIRPILNIIQRIRGFLVALRILHIKWAEKLDKILVRVEKDIYLTFEGVRRTVNDVITILQEIRGIDGLILHGPWLGTAVQLADAIRRIVYGPVKAISDPAAAARIDTYQHYFQISTVKERGALNIKGTLTAEQQETLDDIRARAKAMTSG